MKVLYDSVVFSDQTFGGISHYFVRLMNSLPAAWDYRLSLLASENEYLSLLRRRCPHITLRHFPEHRKLYRLINGFADRRNAAAGGYDVFHATGFTPWYAGRIKSPVVITVHDMIYLDNYREGLLKKEVFDNVEKTIRGADHIIAISEHTRRALLGHFSGISPDKVTVVHHGVDIPSGTLLPLAGIPDNYILFVGHRGGYKNFDTFLEAFAMLAAKDSDIQLVCTGKSFSRGERERIAALGLDKRIHSRFIDAIDMDALYANARCFVFPSRKEGFGMPVLEAFAAGCPVVLSDTSCFPEVAGDGALYFSPDDPEDMACRISSVVYDDGFRDEMVKKGTAMLSRYSWEKTAARTAAVYESLL